MLGKRASKLVGTNACNGILYRTIYVLEGFECDTSAYYPPEGCWYRDKYTFMDVHTYNHTTPRKEPLLGSGLCCHKGQWFIAIGTREKKYIDNWYPDSPFGRSSTQLGEFPQGEARNAASTFRPEIPLPGGQHAQMIRDFSPGSYTQGKTIVSAIDLPCETYAIS